jgi:hypothetical protein
LGRGQPGAHQSLAAKDFASRFNNELVLRNITPLTHLWYFSADRVLGGRATWPSDSTPSRSAITFVNKAENKAEEMELDEIRGSEASWQIKDDKAHLSSSSGVNYGIDPGSGSLIAFCQYLMEPDVSSMNAPSDLSASRYAATQKVSVRNLQDGKLRNSFTLVRADQDNDGYCGVADDFLAVLPGPRVLLKRHVSLSSDKLAEWIDQIREWLGRPPSNNSHLVLVNGMTGDYDANFAIEPDVEQVLFSPAKSELLLVNQDGNGVLIRAFEYPLHKPWLLIVGWSVGMALVMTILVEARRWWKRVGFIRTA